MNPDAEETITERYRTAKIRLRNELKDQLQTRMETLDEHHESLEYAREIVDLCGIEAKVRTAADSVCGFLLQATYWQSCTL